MIGAAFLRRLVTRLTIFDDLEGTFLSGELFLPKVVLFWIDVLLQIIVMRYTRRSIHWLALLSGALLLSLCACNKDNSNPDLSYRVTYAVSTRGDAQVQQIFIKTDLGSIEQIAGQNDFTRAYRFPPGETVSIRVFGFVIDGVVEVRLSADNPENEIVKSEPFTASGDSPTSFEVFLEAELE